MNSESTLLLVDEEPNVLRALQRLLADTDICVLTARSAIEGLEILKQNEVQVVVTDYRMPGMTGAEFFAEVKGRCPEAVRIMLSGSADTAAMAEAINAGEIYRFVPKPWNDLDLLTTIRAAFERFRLQRENAQLYAELKLRYDELQELTKNLEQRVAERTRDLETRNRALTAAHMVIQALPVGVLGIDSEGTIVFVNTALGRFIDAGKLKLGVPAVDVAEREIRESIEGAITGRKLQATALKCYPGIGLVSIPMPGDVGAIGVFCFLNVDDYLGRPVQSAATSLRSQGA